VATAQATFAKKAATIFALQSDLLGRQPKINLRSCCGPLLFQLLLRNFAEAPILISEAEVHCSWLHFDSASRTTTSVKTLAIVLMKVYHYEPS
jgi:hypothetical protein